jgi:hypothetical protein
MDGWMMGVQVEETGRSGGGTEEQSGRGPGAVGSVVILLKVPVNRMTQRSVLGKKFVFFSFFLSFSVQAQVDEVKGIMVNNVDKMLNNMERADDLEQKTCAKPNTIHSHSPPISHISLSLSLSLSQRT